MKICEIKSEIAFKYWGNLVRVTWGVKYTCKCWTDILFRAIGTVSLTIRNTCWTTAEISLFRWPKYVMCLHGILRSLKFTIGKNTTTKINPKIKSNSLHMYRNSELQWFHFYSPVYWSRYWNCFKQTKIVKLK